MKKIYLFLIFLPLLPVFVHAAPYFRIEQTILPSIDSRWELGTSTKAWYAGHFDNICLGGSCRDTWPAGGSGGDTFSTTSADYWKTVRNFHSTTSADYWETQQWRWATTSTDYWQTQRNFFSTTSAAYHLGTFDKGFFFSTTSVDAWEALKARWATTSAEYHLGTLDKGYFFSTTSAAAWDALQARWSTTSADYLQTQRNYFSTTSVDYWKTQNNFFSTTSAQYFVHSSTTIPKTYTANAWTLLQTFSGGFLSSASSTVNSTLTIATTSTGSLNGNVHVTGWPYAQTSAGLQQALNVCSANGGGTVHAAPGSYTISSTPNLTSKCPIVGSGEGTVFVLNTGTTIKIPAGVSHTGLYNLVIDPSALAAGNTYGIYLEDFHNIRIQNVKVKPAPGFALFFTASALATSSELWVTDSSFEGLGTADVIGCGPAHTKPETYVRHIFIENNYVAQDASQGANHKDAINCVAANNVRFANNIVRGGVLFGTEQQPHVNSSIVNNTISGAIGGGRAPVGFVIESGATSTGSLVNISGNTINGGFIDAYSNPSTPLFDGLTIANNTINATGTATTSDEAAIRLVNIKNANVSNNVIATSTSDCIWTNGVASSTFSNNVCGQIAGQAFHEVLGSGNQWILNTVDFARYADTFTGTNTLRLQGKNGFIGINNTTPADVLHVTAGNVQGIRVQSTSNAPVIDLYTGGGSTARNWRFTANFNNSGTFEILRSTSNTGAPATAAVAIDSNSNFGIQTAAPTYPLHVTGAARISSFLDASYFVATTSAATSSLTNLSLSGRFVLTPLAALVTSISGWLGIDTTSGQLRYHDGTASRVIPREIEKSFTLATSTLTYYGGFSASATTSNIRVWNPKRATTITDIYCIANAGTSTIRIGSGSATSTVICGKDVPGTLSSLSLQIAARGSMYLDAGNMLGTPAFFTLTVTGTEDET